MTRVRIIGPGRAGTSLATALSRASWEVLPTLGRGDDLGGAGAETDWARYHAAGVIASNHLVALLGQAERVAATVGAPVEAFLDLARWSLADVAALGPRAALTGPVRRGDTATVGRHLDSLPADERPAYEAMAREAGRLCP